MKNILAIVLVITMIISLAACGSNSADETTAAAQTTKQEAAESESETADTGDDQGQPTTESTTTASNNDASAGDAVKVPDKSLTGLALLESVEWQQPEHFYYRSDVVSAQGTSYTMDFWMDGDSIRVETSGLEDSQTSVMIYNAADKMTYQYIEGQTTGVAMSDDMDDEEDLEDLEDMGPVDLSELVSEDDEYDEVYAEIRQEGGEEVIYIEMTATEDSVTVRSLFWYSLENAFLKASEIYYNDVLNLSQTVVEFDSESDIDNQMFSPPADIEFEDFSMDGILDGLEGFMDGEEFDEDVIDFDDLDLEEYGF